MYYGLLINIVVNPLAYDGSLSLLSITAHCSLNATLPGTLLFLNFCTTAQLGACYPANTASGLGTGKSKMDQTGSYMVLALAQRREHVGCGVASITVANTDALSGRVSQLYEASWYDKLMGNREAPSPLDNYDKYRGRQTTNRNPPPDKNGTPRNSQTSADNRAAEDQAEKEQPAQPCKQGTWPDCEQYLYRHGPGCGKGWIILALAFGTGSTEWLSTA